MRDIISVSYERYNKCNSNILVWIIQTHYTVNHKIELCNNDMIHNYK